MIKTLQLPHLKVSVCPSERGMLPNYHTLVIVFFVLQKNELCDIYTTQPGGFLNDVQSGHEWLVFLLL